MRIRATITNLLGLETSDHVARAQVEALKSRIPYLYAIVSINVLALSYTHFETNPVWQVVILPGLMVSVLATRMIWWTRLNMVALDRRAVAKIRRVTLLLAGVLGIAVLVWALSLHAYTTSQPVSAYMTVMGHVEFFVGITVVSCIFLLMHLRAASILLASSVVVPFSGLLLASGRSIETSIALNLLLVTAAMLYVAVSFARDFERMVATSADLSRLSRQNARLAETDAMTGLPNRRCFFQELGETGRTTRPFAVIAIDLDGFKQVNDIYGHQAGDEVLCAVAGRLQNFVPEGACLARLGGDEFACLVTGEDVEHVNTLASALVGACGMPLECTSFIAKLGASAGICLSEAVTDEPMVVYERADYALLEAKRGGRGRVERFSGVHDRSIRRESAVARLLRSVDLLDELTAVYQPIVAAHTHEIVSFEALVRWTNSEIGPVGPSEFIPIAERTDLIFDISRHLLGLALRDAAQWPETVSIKVNLSVRDLMSSSQTKALLAELEASAVDAARVTFEVTETIFAEVVGTRAVQRRHVARGGLQDRDRRFRRRLLEPELHPRACA